MSKQSYKDIQSDAPARHSSHHFPVENIGNEGYNENAGIMGGQRPVGGGATCTDADNLMPLTDTEREWLIAVGRAQHKRHSDVTYLLAVLEEYLELSEDSELVFDLPENDCGTK